jgi:plastocyanin
LAYNQAVGGSSPSAPTDTFNADRHRSAAGRLRSVRTLRIAAVVAATLVLAACGGDSDSAGDDDPAAGVDGPTVILRDIAFQPDTISVPAGGTVTWVFDDGGIPHNVVAADDSFESETKDSGRFTHTFDDVGTFPYVCTIHPNMKGTVQVT